MPPGATSQKAAPQRRGRRSLRGAQPPVIYEAQLTAVYRKYVSIERGVDMGDTSSWEMITASDAGGALPLVVQKMAITGAIVKDVGLFIKWNDGKRAEAGQAT